MSDKYTGYINRIFMTEIFLSKKQKRKNEQNDRFNEPRMSQLNTYIFYVQCLK